jgi:hypothetical protein
MVQNNVLEKLNALPPAAQQQVLDFIAFLEARYRPVRRPDSNLRLSEETFVGIWKERTDLQDSRKWVRNLRNSEWGSAK